MEPISTPPPETRLRVNWLNVAVALAALAAIAAALLLPTSRPQANPQTPSLVTAEATPPTTKVVESSQPKKRSRRKKQSRRARRGRASQRALPAPAPVPPARLAAPRPPVVPADDPDPAPAEPEFGL